MYPLAQDEDPYEPRITREAPEQPKAFSLLGAHNFREAWQLAERELERARKCGCCATLLAHVYDRLGSDLFLDDDPGTLVRAFDASDRDPFAERVLAARIVTSGRMRVAFAAGEWDS